MISECSHRGSSRTFVGRNTQTQIQQDSLNQEEAARLDREALTGKLIDEGHDASEVEKAFDDLNDLNKKLRNF